MKKVQPVNLTSDEALVLQQIAENGEDDVIVARLEHEPLASSQAARPPARQKTRHH